MAENAYSLRYRTYNQLFEDVTVDMRNYALEGKIDPQSLIKVARRVNYELGLRIHRTRQAVLEVEHGKVRLPDDFKYLNYALMCGEYEVVEALPQGTHIEERLIDPVQYCPDPGQPSTCSTPVDPCEQPDPCNNTCLTKCGDEYQLIQKIHTTKRVYKTFYRLHIEEYPDDECQCPNLFWNDAPDKAKIKNGWLETNFQTGKVYINYEGDMVDNDGNLLVVDHEYLNEFYEYALKKRILENLMGDGEIVDQNYLAIILQEYRAARNNSLSVVNTPNFKELQKIWRMNRKAQYHNYYNMFKSWFPYTNKPYGYNSTGYNGHNLF
jgi:hypothetical protein